MSKKILPAGSEVLMVVAHPDDETIWAGGLILNNPQASWTIVCLCRASDPDRAPKFAKVVKALGARGIILDLEDEGKLNLRASIKPIKKLVLEVVNKQSFDFVFTHGLNGEYGHERHISTHLAIKELVRSQKLKCGQLWCFDYKKLTKYKLAPKAGADYQIKLKAETFERKLSLMTKIYGFEAGGIDAGYCTNPESYKRLI